MEGQEEIKRAVDAAGTDDLVVLLGMPTADSSELYALTVTDGDPSWAGALAGVALKLPVYHVLEPDIKAQIPDDVFERELSFATFSLDEEAVNEATRRIREQNGAG
ncbi:MAG: hypothetical protein IT305_03085 [Chloroflexi bacterium]|nr:hypothetical protein [Chloroflexota bacterium]